MPLRSKSASSPDCFQSSGRMRSRVSLAVSRSALTSSSEATAPPSLAAVTSVRRRVSAWSICSTPAGSRCSSAPFKSANAASVPSRNAMASWISKSLVTCPSSTPRPYSTGTRSTKRSSWLARRACSSGGNAGAGNPPRAAPGLAAPAVLHRGEADEAQQLARSAGLLLGSERGRREPVQGGLDLGLVGLERLTARRGVSREALEALVQGGRCLRGPLLQVFGPDDLPVAGGDLGGLCAPGVEAALVGLHRVGEVVGELCLIGVEQVLLDLGHRVGGTGVSRGRRGEKGPGRSRRCCPAAVASSVIVKLARRRRAVARPRASASPTSSPAANA